jgi:tetratricopeptide (TPR) repeat protein
MKQWIAILVFVVPAIGSRAQNKQEQALLYKANQLYQSGHYNEAEQWYDKVLELNPNNSLALFNKANALQQQKNYEAAAKQFEQAAAVTNDNDLKAKAYYNSGVAAIKQQ